MKRSSGITPINPKDINDLHQTLPGGLSLEALEILAEPMPLPNPEPTPTINADSAEARKVAGWGWIEDSFAWPASEPPQPDWLLVGPSSNGIGPGPGILPAGKVALLAAPGGTGKSYALAALALALVTGRPWFGAEGMAVQGWLHVRPPGGGRVAIIFGEDDPSDVARRFYHQGKALSLTVEDRKRVTGRLLALGGSGRRFTLTTDENGTPPYSSTPEGRGLRRFLEETVQRTGEAFRAIILDPLARFSPPDAEIDNHAATRMIEALEGLTQSEALGKPLVLAAHHTRKAKDGDGDWAADAIRGASGLVDGARWAARMRRIESTVLPRGIHGLVEVRCVKSNVGSWPEPIKLARVEGGALRALQPAELKMLESNEKPNTSASKTPKDGKRVVWDGNES